MRRSSGRTAAARAVACAVVIALFMTVWTGTSWAQVGFDIPAPAAMVVEAHTGQVLFAKHIEDRYPPASIAKIMTMLLALEAVDSGRAKLSDEIRVSAHVAGIGGSQVYMAEGEVFTLEEMLKAVAIHSANDAAVAIAEFLAGTDAAFVEGMNARARELKMEDTRFINPDGLPPNEGEDPNVTSAQDIMIMARELVNKHPKVLEWTSVRRETFREKPKTVLYNTNGLIGSYPGADGLKTGHTERAGWSLVATANRDGRRIISVVLKTDSQSEREQQSMRLLDYGFGAFEDTVVATSEEKVGEIRIPNGQPEKVSAVTKGELIVLTQKGKQGSATRELRAKEGLRAPVEKGQEIGRLVGLVDGKTVTEVPVYATQDVQEAGFFTRIFRAIRDFFLSLFGKGS